METWIIGEHTLEFVSEIHQYVCNGVCLPSVTQMLKHRFGNKYDGVSTETLNHASELGTQMHLAIQEYEESGKDSEMVELRNYKFLKSRYKWECLQNEVPVILFLDDEPIACGRIDMVGTMEGQTGLFDFKRTSMLDKEYLSAQLNLYRIAYMQTYGGDIEFLRGIHLREDKRKVVTIPINEQMAMDLVNEYIATDMVYLGFNQHDCEGIFACPSCGAQYGGWGMIGKSFIKCKCGKTLRVPK